MIITELPITVLNKILSYIESEKLCVVSEVCPVFKELSSTQLRAKVGNVLAVLKKKVSSLENAMKDDLKISMSDKIKLNQSCTILEMIRLEIHTFYVNKRSSMDLSLARFLDTIFNLIIKLNINDLSMWLTTCKSLQNNLTKFNMQKHPQETLPFPLGVHFIDLLDQSIELNYEITCAYNLKTKTCSLSGKYYTDHIKFLSFLPDLFYLTDCKNRSINLRESTSLLRYLSYLVNVYNGLFCKSDEYKREMLIKGGKLWEIEKMHVLENRKCVLRSVEDDLVTDIYKRSSDKDLKNLLSCEVSLTCNLSEAPYQIVRNYNAFINDFSIENENTTIQSIENCSDSTYTAEIKLKLCNNAECYEMVFVDGDEIRSGNNMD